MYCQALSDWVQPEVPVKGPACQAVVTESRSFPSPKRVEVAAAALGAAVEYCEGAGDQHGDANDYAEVPTGAFTFAQSTRVCRQPVRDGRIGRTGADNNVIVGLHVLLPALSLDAFYSGTMPRGDQARQRRPTINASSSLRCCSGPPCQSKAASPLEPYAPAPGNNWNPASSPIRLVVSHRLQSAVTGHSGPFDVPE
jgi:hypothetical protein